jgi:hypothetical protein
MMQAQRYEQAGQTPIPAVSEGGVGMWVHNMANPMAQQVY